MLKWMSSVRAIVTILLTLTYGYLCVTGKIEPKDVQVIIALVMTFYFTKHRPNGGVPSPK